MATRQNRNSRPIPRSRMPLLITAVCGAAFVFAAGWGFNTEVHANTQAPSLQSTVKTKLTKTLVNEKVDVFGGSAAYGFFDPERDSYLQRAFSARTGATNVNYQYINHTVVGGTAFLMEKQHPGQFEAFMKKDRPQIVVFSWGLLNDISSRHKVSVDTFGNAVKKQIAEALAAHTVVLIVTPPVTEESATNDHIKIETYINKLFSVADSFHNPNIINIDVYHQMERYMNAHHQTYKAYYGNSWHPNQAGHILAGELLSNDLIQKFGQGPIHHHPLPT